MSYCINPKCPQRDNSDNQDTCAGCGSSLLINDRYRVVRPLRPLNTAYPTDVYEVKDWGGVDDWGTLKVLKVLRVQHPKLIDLFKREARILMFLRHRGIPEVNPDDYFQFSPSTSTKQLHCLVMEKIEGENLLEWLQQNEIISKDKAIDWLKQLIDILHQIHQHNLFHRDIKPSNIILKPNGDLALIDFGTVREQKNIDTTVTKVGTTGYAAPEQIEGRVSYKADFFALGRTFVHLLTGLSPQSLITDDQPNQLSWRKHAKTLQPWTFRSKALADLIDKMIQTQLDLRPDSTREITKQLEKIAATPDTLINASKRNLALTLVGVILSPFIFQYMPIFINSFMFPQAYKFFQGLGTDNYNKRDLKQAEFYYKIALRFNPKSSATNYSLGIICEDFEDISCARLYYQKAIQLDEVEDKNNPEMGYHQNSAASASSNLCRLEILEKNVPTAIKICSKGLQYKTNYPIIPAALYKNLGWANFIENKLPEAQKNLQQAIALKNQQNLTQKWAAPYCLLAQVLEAKGHQTEALLQWKYCVEEVSPYTLEEQVWQAQAQQRLKKTQ